MNKGSLVTSILKVDTAIIAFKFSDFLLVRT